MARHNDLTKPDMILAGINKGRQDRMKFPILQTMSVVRITVESQTMTPEQLRAFVEKHLSLESASHKDGKQIVVHISTEQ